MYYCNACDEPVLMEQVGGVACCPACEHVDPTVVIRPLFVVTGASGSGKTTIFPELLSRMAGWCAVFDADWLIDPLGRAAKDGQIDWTAFSDTWPWSGASGCVYSLLSCRQFWPSSLSWSLRSAWA